MPNNSLLIDIRTDHSKQGRRLFLTINNDKDVFIDAKTCAEWSSLSLRTIRELLKDPENAIPHYKIGGRVLIAWPEFKRWMDGYKVGGLNNGCNIAERILKRKNG
ncbi:MAG: hypothetical protein PF482_05070 [Desulfobacteraceae bacterium]|nr:hypothetical protein [Desulfobacteraceae bacterium]